MSAWRNVMSYNKYTQVAARAIRSGLKETERVGAEKRGEITLKKQKWQAGQAGESKFVDPAQQAEHEAAQKKKPAAPTV